MDNDVLRCGANEGRWWGNPLAAELANHRPRRSFKGFGLASRLSWNHEIGPDLGVRTRESV